MITPKEAIFDRIEQTFDLFKRNAKEIFLPMFAFQFITTIVLYTIISTVFFSMLNFGDIANSSDAMKSFGNLYTDPQFILFITVSIFLVLSYLTILVPFLVATIRGITLSYKGEDVDMKEIVRYGFMNMGNAFKTYWYIFAYVALIPSLIIILGGLLIMYGQFNDNTTMNIGFYIIFVGISLFSISYIVRGIKSTFALYGAIDKSEYTKVNFINTINITENLWGKIVLNFIILSIIIFTVSGIFGSIISMISGIGGFSITDLLNIKTAEDITKILSNIGKTTIFSILGDTLNLIITTVGGIFTYIFTYIFFKRLELESSASIPMEEEKNIIKENNKEL